MGSFSNLPSGTACRTFSVSCFLLWSRFSFSGLCVSRPRLSTLHAVLADPGALPSDLPLHAPEPVRLFVLGAWVLTPQLCLFGAL